MKEPIKPEDIRKGDVIRCEYVHAIGTAIAEEYRAKRDGHCSGYDARYYLLDRPMTYDERAAWHLAGTLATISKRETGGTSWYNVDHAREAIESLREWEARNDKDRPRNGAS